VKAVGVADAVACEGGFCGIASPAFGGGGTGDCACGAGMVATGAAPGCGGAGDSEVDVVGNVVVGVDLRFVVGAVAAVDAVGTGRAGAAPGCASCAVAYTGAFDGAVAVAEAFGGSVVAVVEASIAVAGSGCEVVA